jgi:uncharacterized protein (UPF0332 family)
MVSINWCFNYKNGLEIVEPSENMSISYMKMAEESMAMIKKNEESRIWTASTSYYTMYYCLYSIMMKIGIKCEIHKCSIEFMKHFLHNYYNDEELELIKIAFDVRNILQYYPDKLMEDSKLDIVKKGAVDFLVKTKQILTSITENEIKDIRSNMHKLRNKK